MTPLNIAGGETAVGLVPKQGMKAPQKKAGPQFPVGCFPPCRNSVTQNQFSLDTEGILDPNKEGAALMDIAQANGALGMFPQQAIKEPEQTAGTNFGGKLWEQKWWDSKWDCSSHRGSFDTIQLGDPSFSTNAMQGCTWNGSPTRSWITGRVCRRLACCSG